MTASRPDLKRQAYYAEAATWAQDGEAQRRASRRTAWIVAACALAVAVLEAVALAALLPLKTERPYAILVDRQTGAVQVAQPLAPGRLSQNAAVAQSQLVQYVLARETYDATTLRDDYRKTQTWSAPDARDAYVRAMARTNPQSPLALYPPAVTVRAVVKSVTLLSPTTALVRFDAERRDPGSAQAVVQPYTAAVAFRWSGAPLRLEDRWLNPLGFQVTRYRRDAETTGAVVVPATVSSGPLQP